MNLSFGTPTAFASVHKSLFLSLKKHNLSNLNRTHWDRPILDQLFNIIVDVNIGIDLSFIQPGFNDGSSKIYRRVLPSSEKNHSN